MKQYRKTPIIQKLALKHKKSEKINLKTELKTDFNLLLKHAHNLKKSRYYKNNQLLKNLSNLFKIYNQINKNEFTFKQIRLIHVIIDATIKESKFYEFNNFKYPNKIINQKQKTVEHQIKEHPIYGKHPIPKNQDEIDTFLSIQKMEKSLGID